MNILIGADIVPTRSNIELFKQGNSESLVGEELACILKRASYRVFNLEVPLTDKEEPIAKFGPNLIAPVTCIEGYKALGTDLVTIANNHILDQGVQGLISTIETLEQASISYVGAGDCIYTAQKPLIVEIDGKSIGFYACAEHEFSIANDNSAGANPFDPLESLDQVLELKTKCEFVIVLYHGGKEYYRYPSPGLQKTCRKIVEKGADLVICQHSHCIGCKEEYMDGTIVYGQGDFLFDGMNNEYRENGLLINILDLKDVRFIPIEKNGNTVHLADKEKSEKIMDLFNERSERIKQPGFIKESYDEYAKESIDNYLLLLSGKKTSIAFRVFNRILGSRMRKKVTQKYIKKTRYGLKNYIECEAHRELIIKGLELL